jgi:uncharacterized protein (TIGR00251 family)
MEIEERAGTVRFRVWAQPRASRTELAGERDGALRVRIAAPPVDGEANEELIRFFAGLLRVARSRIRVRAGAGSRTKQIEVEGVDAATVRRALEV